MDRNELIRYFDTFSFGREPGIGNWLSKEMHELVGTRLQRLSMQPLSKVQFNQLLVVSQVASVSDGFFRYYWCTNPSHPYDTANLQTFDAQHIGQIDSRWWDADNRMIRTLPHLRWGLYRLYVDGLLYFGNVRAAFNQLRSLTYEDLVAFFVAKRFDTGAIASRGPALPLNHIDRDDRYLISEMACKTFGDLPGDHTAALEVLRGAWDKHVAGGGSAIPFREILKRYITTSANEEQYLLSFDGMVDKSIDSRESLDANFESEAKRFLEARTRAIANTELYLSMVNDLDVYVATSMRTKTNFCDMADACKAIFEDFGLNHLHLRYFDPTLSAAKGHEDKGLIECLMVKCAKLLVYCEGEKESYGKDAEAAMALSLGKPVIFYCDRGKKTTFYRDVHPLSRLIDFRTGVAVGAIVSDDVVEVARLIKRTFENEMGYRLEHHPNRTGFLKLTEELTGSVVRLQTNDELIAQTFWNNYSNRGKRVIPSLAAGKELERMRE